jgi:nucleotide-binding universal stress UspA family protein
VLSAPARERIVDMVAREETHIRTVLCPVDFSDASEHQALFAADLCQLYGARLVLHHNVEDVSAGVAVSWMWAGKHAAFAWDIEAERRMKSFVGRIPAWIPMQARITHGPPTGCVLAVAGIVDADVLVLTIHGRTGEDHMSLTEQVLERSCCAVMALHEATGDPNAKRFACRSGALHRVLAPTSFSETSAAAVRLCFDLARRLPIELHLLHIEPSRTPVSEPDSAQAEADRRRLSGLLPNDLRERAKLHVAAGDPAREIPAMAEALGASLIVMGEHTRAPLRRWFTRDTGRSVLREANCPVWYVP